MGNAAGSVEGIARDTQLYNYTKTIVVASYTAHEITNQSETHTYVLDTDAHTHSNTHITIHTHTHTHM